MQNTNSFSSAESSDRDAEASTNIKVFVRARPPEDSQPSDFIDISNADNDNSLTVKDPESTTANKTYSETKFEFDKIFWSDATQEDVFNKVCKPQVDHVLSGYNGCCFAYGQTGSGKTYSMFGGEGDTSGLAPRAVEYLFGKAYLLTTNMQSSPTAAVFEKTSDLFASIELKRKNSFFARAFSRSKLTNEETTP
eukprot:gene56499-75446_t